jgi:hypothetical protein
MLLLSPTEATTCGVHVVPVVVERLDQILLTPLALLSIQPTIALPF